jgi:hypothetical protein
VHVRVVWPLAAGVLFCVGVIISIVALANAFDGLRFPFYGAPDEGCVVVSDETKRQFDDVSGGPLNWLLVTASGSALMFGIAARHGLTRRAGRVALPCLLAASVLGALFSRTAFAADDFTMFALTGAGVVATLVAWLVLRQAANDGPRNTRPYRWTVALTTAYLIVLPLVVLAVSQTGETSICM